MKRFIEGENRSQTTLFPESLDDYIAEDNAIRVIDAFVDRLDLHELGFTRAEPSATGRPGYHPATMLKIYVYGYLNRIQSSRRLERVPGWGQTTRFAAIADCVFLELNSESLDLAFEAKIGF